MSCTPFTFLSLLTTGKFENTLYFTFQEVECNSYGLYSGERYETEKSRKNQLIYLFINPSIQQISSYTKLCQALSSGIKTAYKIRRICPHGAHVLVVGKRQQLIDTTNNISYCVL